MFHVMCYAVMLWIIISIIARFLDAWVAILDKIILEHTVFKPVPYTFFSGILSIFTIILIIPASYSVKILGNFYLPKLSLALFDLFLGFILIGAIFSLYSALSRAEASRVMTFIGGLVQIFTFGLAIVILDEKIKGATLIAFLLLLGASLLIASSYSHFRLHGVLKYAVISALLWAIFFVLIKLAFSRQSFVTTIVWMEFGFFLGTLLFLLKAKARAQIFETLLLAPKKKSHIALLIFNKALARVSSLLIIFAVSLGSVTLVNALEGVKYAFIFLIAVLLSGLFPRILKEELTPRIVFQKSLAIAFIGMGIFMLVYK